MKNLLQKLFDIREGEATRTFLLFFYIFAVIFCLVMLKAVRESLFLQGLSPKELPNVFILVAVVAAIVSTLYSRFSNKIPLNKLMAATLVLIISNLVGFWLLLYFDYQVSGRGFLYGFYTWVAIYGVIATSQFWILVNYIFNARQAKRLLGVLGAGAISGGIFGGYLANLAKTYGTANLLILCIALMVFCLIVLLFLWKKRESGQNLSKTSSKTVVGKSASTNLFKLFAGSRHLLYLAGIVGVGVIVANLVDYQYKTIVAAEIEDTDERTAFFGFWLSNLSIASLFIQLFITQRFLKSFGVGPSLFLLPIAILFGAIAILLFPGLAAAILVKVADGSFKQSINKSGIELLVLPIPSDIKPRVKSFIDVFIDSFATGVGGILIILATGIWNFSTGDISYLVFGFVLIWLVMIYNVRKEYVAAFRHAIEKRAIDLNEFTVNPNDAALLDNFLKVLDDNNERQMLYVLTLFEQVEHKRFVPYLEKLIEHPSEDIRRQVLKMMQHYRGEDFSAQVEKRVNDDSQEVRVAAIQYLLEKTPNTQKMARLENFFKNKDYRIHGAALLSAARLSAKNPALRSQIGLKRRVESILKSFKNLPESGNQRQFTRIYLAKTIGAANMPELHPYLHILLNDTDAEVLQHAIHSAGATKALEFVPVLIPFLNNKQQRKFAVEALAAFGEPAVPALNAYLHDLYEPRQLRLNIPRVISMIPSQPSVDALIENLKHDDLLIRFQVLKALNKLRKKATMLKFPDKIVEKQIMDESKNYMDILTVLYTQQNNLQNGKTEAVSPDLQGIADARKLLIKALEEKLDKNLERIFRLLGLKYAPKEMFDAYSGIKSTQQDVRANAVEFLDNVLESGLKKLIIPIVESPVDSLIEIGKETFDINVPNEEECIARLLKNHDDWLKACALHLIAELKADAFVEAIGSMVNSREPIIKETAEYALRKLEMAN